MIQSGKCKRILSRTVQMVLLLGVIVIGGFLLPTYTAPFVFKTLSITPLSGDKSQVSLQVTNRNINSGESFQVTASSPKQPVTITTISYPCEFDNVSLRYEHEDSYRVLPCGTTVTLPEQSLHEAQLVTSRQRISYMPVSLSLRKGSNQSRDISFVLVFSQNGITTQSQMSDEVSITLNQFWDDRS